MSVNCVFLLILNTPHTVLCILFAPEVVCFSSYVHKYKHGPICSKPHAFIRPEPLGRSFFPAFQSGIMALKSTYDSNLSFKHFVWLLQIPAMIYTCECLGLQLEHLCLMGGNIFESTHFTRLQALLSLNSYLYINFVLKILLQILLRCIKLSSDSLNSC